MARTICILRRIHRKSLSMWPWSGFTPIKAQPEELRFDLLDESEKVTGTITYTKYAITSGELSTPWGLARIGYGKSMLSGPTLFLRDREFVRMKPRPLKKFVEFAFSNGPTLNFYTKRRSENDLEYIDARGFFGLREEKGMLPEGQRIPVLPTRQEIMMLPKDQRPRSVETREYKQLRFTTSGELPVKLEDLTTAMVLLASWTILFGEVPS